MSQIVYVRTSVILLSILMIKFASLLGLRIMSLPESSPGGVGVGGGGVCPGLNNLEYSLYKNAFL